MNSPHYLVFHSSYSMISLSLFCAGTERDSITEKSTVMSATLLVHLNTLLKKHSLTLHDLAFIGVHTGPGPFTTIRVLVTYANGLAFAGNTKLIEINGFDAFLSECNPQHADYTLVLFNAFCNECYYALRENRSDNKIKHDILLKETFIETGCLPISALCSKLEAYAPYTIHAVGAGVITFNKELLELKSKLPALYIPDPLPEFPSINAMGETALTLWKQDKMGQKKLLPLYLKQAVMCKKSGFNPEI